MILRRVSHVALLSLLCAGCTGKAPEDLPKYPDVNSYCLGRAQAECNDTVIAACAAPSKDKCVTARQAACSGSAPVGKTYDPSKAEACIAQVSAAYGDAKVTKDEIDAFTEVCALLFSGMGAQDASCAVDEDCQQSGGLRCVFTSPDGGVRGTCQVPKAAQGGESCAALDVRCAEGYHCGATSHCDINGDSGEPCSTATPCKSMLKCSAASLCEPKLATGSACTTSDECVSGICLEQSNICVAQITLAPNEPFCVQSR